MPTVCTLKLSSRKCPHLFEVFSDKINNDTKYRKSAHSLVSAQTMMAKVKFLHKIADSMDPSENKSRIMQVAVLVNDVTASMVHDMVEKAICARMSAWKDVAKHLT